MTTKEIRRRKCNFPVKKRSSGLQSAEFIIEARGLTASSDVTDSPLSLFHPILVISDADLMQSAGMMTLRNAFELTAAESQLADFLQQPKGNDPLM
ncbi:hypothetical protein [Bradyrhizobium symbiodeficiens]|uniref:hypothetical protein n=1 Tax=Bradyrhizobium symbiodeficiens TaxID=1404367 RepID=UPI001FCEEDCC|nr:hypothetical protein [Bradyrhizobium symbiodeficiens]